MKMKKIFYFLPFLLLTSNSFAVDARSYSFLPDDINLAEISYTSVSTEKTLVNTIKVKNEAQLVTARYLRTFNFLDNVGAAYVLLPYVKNEGNLRMGSLNLTEQSSSMGDARIFLALGVYNAPALSREEFAKTDKNGTRGVCSMALTLPTGSYDQTKNFNIGSNHYSLKNECAVTYTKNAFVAEFINGFTTYGDNKEYGGGKIKSQKDMYHSELHLTYNITPTFWSGVDLFYQHGGEQSINDVSSRDKLDNTMVGLVANYTISKGEYIKANYIKTVSSPQYAAKSNYFILTYQRLF